MGGLKYRDVVGGVGAWGNTHAPNFGGCGIGKIIPVEIHGRNHIEFGGPQLQQLKNDVRDTILDNDLACGDFAAMDRIQFFFGNHLVAKFLFREFVTPVAKGAFGELHDVTFVDQGNALTMIINRVLDGLSHQSLGAKGADRLDPKTRIFEKLSAHLLA